eukprot:541147_1
MSSFRIAMIKYVKTSTFYLFCALIGSTLSNSIYPFSLDLYASGNTQSGVDGYPVNHAHIFKNGQSGGYSFGYGFSIFIWDQSCGDLVARGTFSPYAKANFLEQDDAGLAFLNNYTNPNHIVAVVTRDTICCRGEYKMFNLLTSWGGNGTNCALPGYRGAYMALLSADASNHPQWQFCESTTNKQGAIHKTFDIRSILLLNVPACTLPPTNSPTRNPTNPTPAPSDPTSNPTVGPTNDPTSDPTINPTFNPTLYPTYDPTTDPTLYPTHDPTTDPTLYPTFDPTNDPTNDPTINPTNAPSSAPTVPPTNAPSESPTACVDYGSSFIAYNSNDGNDNISDINISPQIQESFDLSMNESVLFYDDPPTPDSPVPYINAWIGCNASNETVCSIHCIGPASCLLANIIPSSPFMERILIRCYQKFSCRSMTLNYSQSLSPNTNEISIECSALLACNEYVINLLSESASTYYDANDTELYLTLYCMETLSCKATTINIRQSFASVYINVYCVRENSCKQLTILNEHNEDVYIQLWSFEYSESVEVKTTATGYNLVDVHCGNEEDARYLRYDTSNLLNDEELLSKARREYTSRRLPCEGITITCTNVIDEQVYDQQCAMRYTLSDMVDVTQIIESKRDCFWIDVNQLYTPQCVGSCGQNFTLYEYTMSVELEINLGINEDDRQELYDFFDNDTSVFNIDEVVCDEYFGDVNVTAQTLTSIDAIVNAALRFYADTELIHDIEKHPDSHPLNESINCDGFNMQTDVILINSTFSVQSIIPNRDEVDVLFAPESIFDDEVHDLFNTYYGENLVPVFVTKNESLAPSIDPTPRPTRSPIECPYNTFQYGTSDVRCYECEEDIGYECKGGSILNVVYGHWLAAHHTNGSFLSSPDTMNINDSIVSLRCPAGQCCASHNGCDYFTNSPELCAANRNLSSVTCSRCNDGFDQLLGSSVCGTCERTNYWLILLLFMLALVFTLILLFLMARPNQLLSNISNMALKEINWHKLLYYDQKDLVIVLISKICMYYYQGLSQILLTKNISPSSEFEKVLLSLFDFDLSSYSSEGGICFIGGIHSGIYNLLVSYTWHIFVIASVALIAFIWRYVPCTACKPYIKTGCISIILMTSGPILSTSFKLLTCIKLIDNKYYHFYDADMACFGSIWWSAGILPIVILCGVWIVFWCTIHKQDALQREYENSAYRPLTKRFKYNLWQWEFVLFVRRFGVAALTSFYGIANMTTSILLAAFIVFLLALQTRYNPFKHRTANQVESMCLFGTTAIVIALIVMDEDSIYISWYLSVLILLPLFIVCVIIIITIYKWFASKDTPLDRIRIQDLKQRWLEIDNVSQMQMSRVLSRVPMQAQIHNAKSIAELIPIMEYIGIEDLKTILAKYYDDRDKDGDYQSPRSSVADMDTNKSNTVSIGDAGGETVHVEMVQPMDIRVADGPQNRDRSISSPRNLDENPIREDHTENKHKNDEEPTGGTISNKKQEKLIDLYATNLDLWRKTIVTTIREYPHQFNIILEILK